MKLTLLTIALFYFSIAAKSQVLIGATVPQIKELIQAKGLFKLTKNTVDTTENGIFTKLTFKPKDGTKNVVRTYTISSETGFCTIYSTTQPNKVMKAFYAGLLQSGYRITKGGGWQSRDGSIFLLVEKGTTTFSATFINNIFKD